MTLDARTASGVMSTVSETFNVQLFAFVVVVMQQLLLVTEEAQPAATNLTWNNIYVHTRALLVERKNYSSEECR